MTTRSFGSPNPNKASILRDDPRFQGSGTHFSAEGRQALARQHTAQRNAHVLELLCGLSAMASRGRDRHAGTRLRALPTASVTCEAAILQRYSYPSPDQGAHFLPGQLFMNGLPPWSYVSSSVARIFLMDMFADVERLNANFNRADSAAEAGPQGLKALAEACAMRVIRDPSLYSGGRANRQFVWNVYTGLWLQGSERSLAIALDQKKSRPQVPEVQYANRTFQPDTPSSFDSKLITNLEEIGEAGNSEWNIRETIKILEDYRVNAAAGPGAGEMGRIADRAESGLRGNAVVLEAI